jgi:hypothetical protein
MNPRHPDNRQIPSNTSAPSCSAGGLHATNRAQHPREADGMAHGLPAVKIGQQWPRPSEERGGSEVIDVQPINALVQQHLPDRVPIAGKRAAISSAHSGRVQGPTHLFETGTPGVRQNRVWIPRSCAMATSSRTRGRASSGMVHARHPTARRRSTDASGASEGVITLG